MASKPVLHLFLMVSESELFDQVKRSLIRLISVKGNNFRP
jgi:hypothetical protein